MLYLAKHVCNTVIYKTNKLMGSLLTALCCLL